ncbi:MAG TPA: hypothetical protein VFW65_14460 [Pseudonocardiaceae bacterium]|nr:hypothetical protein [Pseudonocardiaceae bacterium]
MLHLEARIAALLCAYHLRLVHADDSELVNGSPDDLRRAVEMSGVLTPGETTYRLLAQLGSWIADPERPSDFVLTMRAMAELALFAPILPELTQLRGEFQPSDHLPLLRWIALLNLDVEPAHDLRDALRFQHEAAHRLGWPSPQQIAATAQIRKSTHSGQRDHLFATSLVGRRLQPGLFVDPLSAIRTSGAQTAVRELIQFATIEFADGRVLTAKEPRLRGPYQLEWLWNRWLRHAMISREPELELPWPSGTDELADLARFLQRRLSDLLDTDMPPPRLRARRRRLAR